MMIEYLRCLLRRFSGLILSLITLAIPFGVRAQDQIVVGYDGHAGFQGPIWATKDLGLLDKYGVPGELVLIPGSARGMAALISGSVPFSQGSGTAPLAAYLRGGDVVVVAAALNKFPFSVVARKELRNPSDLIAKKIGILNFGGSNDLAVTLAFKEWNIPRNAFYGPKFSFPPRVDRGGVNNALELVRQGAEIKGEVNLSQFADESVIDELEKEGFYKRLVSAGAKK
jgi:NMT1/THI5 like